MQATDYPAIFVAADTISQSGQRTYIRLVQFDLLLVVFAAALSVIGTFVQGRWSTWISITTAIVLVMALITRFANKTLRTDREWFGGRAVAESVKTLTWRFMMRAEPYNTGDRDAEARFLQELAVILKERKELSQDVGSGSTNREQITPHMRQIRLLPLHERKAYYLRESN